MLVTHTCSEFLEPVHRETVYPLEDTSLALDFAFNVSAIGQQLVGEVTIKYNSGMTESSQKWDTC